MVIKTQNGRNTQLWWFDQASLTIRTKLNNQSWDIKSSGRTNNMQIWSTNSGWFQIFTYRDEHFCNIQDQNRCIDVSGGKDEEGREVIVWKKHGGANQRWKVIYQDEAEKVQEKGLNENFGWHCNRPFYMVSRLPLKKVAEMVGASNIALKRFVKGRLAQQFWFDCTSKTIKSQQWKNYCLTIPSNGGSNELKATSGCSSRWW
jgi:hypothetical protein